MMTTVRSLTGGGLSVKLLVSIGVLLFTKVAIAETYPSKPVTLVVPYAAGGVADNQARLVAGLLGAKLGQPVIVENRGGAGGAIGSQAVASAQPNGYTLLYGSIGPLVVSLTLMKEIPYHPLKNFVPVHGLSDTPMILVVSTDSPYRNLKDLIDDARKKPGQLNFGSPGTGAGPHLAGALLQMGTAIDAVHIPYKGAAPAMTDLLGGRLQFMFDYISTSSQLIESGKLRALGLTSPSPLPTHPEFQTFASMGYPDLVFSSWAGIFAPAGTPQEIVDRLSSACRELLKDPKVADYNKRFGVANLDLNPKEFRALIERDIPRMRAIVEKAGATATQ